MKACFRLLCFGLTLAGGSPGLTREPTDLEQYYLELINRARANPNGEVSRLSGEVWGDEGSPAAPNLNEGLPPGTISSAPKPPLAFDPRLIEAADAYSRLLLEFEQFSHTADGSTSRSRMEAQGYVFVPNSASGENLATTASTGPHPVDLTRVSKHHEGLFIDGDVAGRGHRRNLLEPFFREVGIAILADEDGESIFGSGFNEVLSAQDFATSSGRIFVTGVIFHDGNANRFYDPGESAGVLPLRIEDLSGNQVASGTSFASGGYSINLASVSVGTYLLIAQNEAGAAAEIPFVWDGQVNVRADLIDPFIPHRPDARIGKAGSQLSGNGIYSNTGAEQSVRQTATTLRSLTWNVAIDNNGTQTDDFLILGTSGNRLFRISYFRSLSGGLSNETAALATGLFHRDIPTGERIDYRILIKPNRSALGKRVGITGQIRVISGGDSGKVDQVNAVVLNRTRKTRNRR